MKAFDFIQKDSNDKKILLSSLTMTCESPIQNRESVGINSTVFNITCYEEIGSPECIQNVPIINPGTIVYNQAWKCDGNVQCFEDLDERHCGFDTFYIIFLGFNYGMF